jgi:hypothetical protein
VFLALTIYHYTLYKADDNQHHPEIPIKHTTSNSRRNASNLTLHNDLKIPFVNNEILSLAARYKAQIANHDNKLVEELYTNGPVTRRLHRTWPQDIINQ